MNGSTLGDPISSWYLLSNILMINLMYKKGLTSSIENDKNDCCTYQVKTVLLALSLTHNNHLTK